MNTHQKRLKALQEDAASDRAAAVGELLSARRDLSADQRARLVQIGMVDGISTLRSWLRDVVPPPRCGAGSVTMLKSSADEKMNRLFKIMPDAAEGNGFTAGDRSDGRLCTASIVGALATIRAATAHNVATLKAKMARSTEVQR